jgi:hypothetical protein
MGVFILLMLAITLLSNDNTATMSEYIPDYPTIEDYEARLFEGIESEIAWCTEHTEFLEKSPEGGAVGALALKAATLIAHEERFGNVGLTKKLSKGLSTWIAELNAVGNSSFADVLRGIQIAANYGELIADPVLTDEQHRELSMLYIEHESGSNTAKVREHCEHIDFLRSNSFIDRIYGDNPAFVTDRGDKALRQKMARVNWQESRDARLWENQQPGVHKSLRDYFNPEQ